MCRVIQGTDAQKIKGINPLFYTGDLADCVFVYKYTFLKEYKYI